MILAALLVGALANETVALAAVGDVMLGRYVGRRIEREGADALFAAARPALKADLGFANLECVLGDAPFTQARRIRLRGAPASARALAKAGFNVVSVANNHALDAGEAGLRQTLASLREAGIVAAGLPGGPVVLERKGLRVGFLAYSDFPTEPSRAIARTDEATLAGDIAALRQEADIVAVSWHWGTEGLATADPRQRRLAGAAARAGADLILGHHPHVVQPIEWLAGKDGRRCLVAYSLGNFVFDAVKPAERETLVLRARLTKHGVAGYTTVPCRITRGAPSPIPARNARPRPRTAPGPPGSAGRTETVR